ncbi:MAG: lipoprotein 17-related variable surface protein [Helicobacteraceae bacterium]
MKKIKALIFLAPLFFALSCGSGSSASANAAKTQDAAHSQAPSVQDLEGYFGLFKDRFASSAKDKIKPGVKKKINGKDLSVESAQILSFSDKKGEITARLGGEFDSETYSGEYTFSGFENLCTKISAALATPSVSKVNIDFGSFDDMDTFINAYNAKSEKYLKDLELLFGAYFVRLGDANAKFSTKLTKNGSSMKMRISYSCLERTFKNGKEEEPSTGFSNTIPNHDRSWKTDADKLNAFLYKVKTKQPTAKRASLLFAKHKNGEDISGELFDTSEVAGKVLDGNSLEFKISLVGASDADGKLFVDFQVKTSVKSSSVQSAVFSGFDTVSSLDLASEFSPVLYKSPAAAIQKPSCLLGENGEGKTTLKPEFSKEERDWYVKFLGDKGIGELCKSTSPYTCLSGASELFVSSICATDRHLEFEILDGKKAGEHSKKKLQVEMFAIKK